ETDRREILDWIVRELRIERGIDPVRRRRTEEQRVAIRRRLRNELGADRSGRTGAVVDDNRLSETVGELLTDRTRDQIERTARGEGRYQADGLCRITLREHRA